MQTCTEIQSLRETNLETKYSRYENRNNHRKKDAIRFMSGFPFHTGEFEGSFVMENMIDWWNLVSCE